MRIVLAVDGSEGSYQAVHAISHLAPPKKLVVLYAMDVPRLAYPVTTPGIQKQYEKVARQAMKQEGERILNQVASMLPALPSAIAKRVQAGAAADVILTMADRVRAKLIVIGSRGLGQVTELLLGSVSHRVTTHAPCSTLLVKSSIARLAHILLPIQGKEDAEAAIRFLSMKPFGGPVSISVLHVFPAELHPGSLARAKAETLRYELRAAAEKLTSDVAERLGSLGYSTIGRVEEGAPAACILKTVSAEGADLIVMGARVRSSVSRFLLGSVSHAVVHHAPLSVLLLRSEKKTGTVSRRTGTPRKRRK